MKNKLIKSVFKTKSGKAWLPVSAALIALFTTVTTLTTTTYRSILGTVLGGPRPIQNPDVTQVYKSNYKSKKEVLDAGNKLNLEIEKEGATLLLNENNALPLKKNSKVSVFGRNSIDLVLSGSGSGSGGSEGAKTLYDGLLSGGFQVNNTLKDFYTKNGGKGRSSNPQVSEGTTTAPTLDIGETPISKYTSEVKSSFDEYSDAAIVVISRIGGESFDLPRSQNIKNGGIAGNHYLQLDENEYALLDMVTAKFDKVVVLLNTLTSFQLDFIDEYNNTASNKRIDAVMWIGGPGVTGAEAIGSLLNGETNPSGRTVDLYSRDFTKDPTWKNFGDNSQNFNGISSAGFTQNGTNVAGKYMVSYEEGIYVGYRYYETRAYEESLIDSSSTWYDENVMYPFGYGLSYTQFEQSMTVSGNWETGLTFNITVKNIGEVPGKDTVQLYASLPYTKGGIEKSHIQLVDFGKTKLLDKNESQVLTIKVNPYDLASYDYNDANHNNFKGYELEKGDYKFFISKHSHVETGAYDSEIINLSSSMRFENDTTTNEPVLNRFTFGLDENDNINFNDVQYRLHDVIVETSDGEDVRKGMSRSNFEGTFPISADENAREFFEGEEDALNDRKTNNPLVNEFNEMPKTNQEVKVMLRDLYGKAYEDAKWDELLDSLSYNELIDLVNHGAFQTNAIMKIGKNLTNDSDGPVGFVNFMPGLSQHYKGNTSFACEIVIASTWNKDLAYQMGKIVGETGLWGDVNGNNLPYTGWYAPAVNIHRSPFAGRNYEYFSEDPILSGKLAVNVINGAAQKGVYTDLKHFALNDQETNRGGVATYCTEQALREIYLKPFEIAVKGYDDPSQVTTASLDGITKFNGSTGIMSSFNRIGTRWTGGDYRLMTEILRNEWGFRGLVICDYKTDNSVMDSRQMLYAGNDLILASLENLLWTDSSSSSAADVTILRQAAHNILYTVANSNSVNVDIVGYGLEVWVICLIVADVLVACGICTWGILATRRGYKLIKKEEEQK